MTGVELSRTFSITEISEEDRLFVDSISGKYYELGLQILDNIAECRLKSIALTKLEESFMFAVKAIKTGG